MIRIDHYYGRHQGGTKDYHLYLFLSEKSGGSILIKTWGKNGTVGQCKVEICGSRGETALLSAIKEREAKGYDMRDQFVGKNRRYLSVPEALDVLPQTHRRSITNAQLSLLDGKSFSSTDRSAYDPLSSDRDKMRESMEASAAVERDRKIAAEIAVNEDFLKSNPLFGMF